MTEKLTVKTFEELCDSLEDCIINNKNNISIFILKKVPINIIKFQNNFSNLRTSNLLIDNVYFKNSLDLTAGRFCLYTEQGPYYNCIYDWISKLMYASEDYNITTVFYNNINKESTLKFIESKRKDYIYEIIKQMTKINNSYIKIRTNIDI